MYAIVDEIIYYGIQCNLICNADRSEALHTYLALVTGGTNIQYIQRN
jgi:hypothetical protein